MQYCIRCVYPSNHPLGITFDDEGICIEDACKHLYSIQDDFVDWGDDYGFIDKIGSLIEEHNNIIVLYFCNRFFVFSDNCGTNILISFSPVICCFYGPFGTLCRTRPFTTHHGIIRLLCSFPYFISIHSIKPPHNCCNLFVRFHP